MSEGYLEASQINTRLGNVTFRPSIALASFQSALLYRVCFFLHQNLSEQASDKGSRLEDANI